MKLQDDTQRQLELLDFRKDERENDLEKKNKHFQDPYEMIEKMETTLETLTEAVKNMQKLTSYNLSIMAEALPKNEV